MRVRKDEKLIYRNVGETEEFSPNSIAVKVGDEK